MYCNGIIKISREIRRDENIYSMRSQLGFTWARTDGHCRRNIETGERVVNFLINTENAGLASSRRGRISRV